MKLSTMCAGLLVGVGLGVPAESQAIYIGETVMKCQTGYVVVDGIAYGSKVCWTEVNYYDVGGLGSFSDPWDWRGDVGRFFDEFGSVKIGNPPTSNPNPATATSTVADRWAHAVFDAAYWILKHPYKSQFTSTVTVKYDDGSTESWTLTHMSDTLAVVPVAGSLRSP